MDVTVDVAIIGAGTAGLSARKEVEKVGKSYVLIDPGPYGTTCARVGCMPSKVLIHCANEFYRRHKMKTLGIHNVDQLSVDVKVVMQHVRKMRDHFTDSVARATEDLDEKLIRGAVKFIDPNKLAVNDKIIHAHKIIVATGSSSIVPKPWQEFSNKILTSENIFEQIDFPKKMAVIGAGVIGLELGQALSRLGVEISLFHGNKYISGLSDPEINAEAITIFEKEFFIHLDELARVTQENHMLVTKTASVSVTSEKILAAIGRKPNLTELNLGCLQVPIDENGIPQFNPATMQVGDTHVFIAGDANTMTPLLHEAADEGRIAGFNASRDEVTCFKRRVPMYVVFTDPNIAIVGQSFAQLQGESFVTGKIDFTDQGRAKIIQENHGRLHVYVAPHSGKLLGAEMISPEGEHLAHILAWAIQQELTVFDMLQMPFYHPVIEEGLRTALRDAASQIKQPKNLAEVAMCDSEAVHKLS